MTLRHTDIAVEKEGKRGRLPRLCWQELGRTALLLLGPLAAAAACQVVSLQSWEEASRWLGGHAAAVAAVWGLLSCALWLVYGLTRLASLSLLLTEAVPLALTLVSYYKTAINGEPLMLTDFALAGDFGGVAGFAMDRIAISDATWGALALAAAPVLLALVLDFLPRRLSLRGGMVRAGAALLALGISAVTWLEPFCAAQYEAHPTQVDRDAACGVPLSLLSTALGARAAGSEAYSELRMQRLLQEMEGDLADQEAERGAARTPHIIFIMNESFMDVTRLPNVTFSEDPLANYHALAETAQSGRFYSITTGGGTGWVEMESFMGVPTAMIDPNRANTELEAEEYEALPSYVKVLKANGYQAIGFHAHTNALYNRDANFPRIGFDEMLFMEAYQQQATYEGLYFDDDSTANVLISLFEENREGPLYLYAMTMQNHQPYYGGRYTADRLEVTSDRLSGEDLAVLQCYVNGIYDADRMLGKLTDYFSQVDEPVLLVFAGDHTASMYLSDDQSVYSALGYVSAPTAAGWTAEDYQRMLSTDYLIWANFDLGETAGTRRDLSASFMAAELLALAGVDNTPYYAWLRETGRGLMTYRSGNVLVDAAGNRTADLGEEADTFYTAWQDTVYDMLQGEGYVAGRVNQVHRTADE